jgi:hypothetical protein
MYRRSPSSSGWHELAADLRRGKDRHDENHRGNRERRPGPGKDKIEHGPVERDQRAIQGVQALLGDFAANEVAHEHRNQRDREPGRRGHRIRLRVRQRREEPPFLRLEREDGDERQRDDEQAEEKRRPDFGGGLGHDTPVLFAAQLAPGMGLVPRLDVLVGVLDHHHGRVHHGADRDRDAAQGHDVGVDALVVHHDECDEHAERKGDDRHERRSQVKQEHEANEGDDDEFLDELLLQVGHGALDQL